MRGSIQHRRRRRPVAERANDAGALALELAVLAPALLAVAALLLAYGRHGQTVAVLESAARDSARVATDSRSLAEATERIDAVVGDAEPGLPRSCSRTLRYSLEGDGIDAVREHLVRGGSLTVTVTCTLELRDLGLPGAPGSVSMRRAFTSLLDPYRGVR